MKSRYIDTGEIFVCAESVVCVLLNGVEDGWSIEFILRDINKVVGQKFISEEEARRQYDHIVSVFG